MQRISFINSNNTQLVNDYDLEKIASFLTKNQSGVMYDDQVVKAEFNYSGGIVAPGKAVIQSIRVASTPINNQKIALVFESDTPVNLPEVVGNKVYIEINNTLLQDQTQIIDIPPSTDYALGLNIAEIKSTPSYPSHPNYIPLWEITAGPTLVDVRAPLLVDGNNVDLSNLSQDINTTGNITADEITANNINADTITTNNLILPGGDVQDQIDNLSTQGDGVIKPAGEDLLLNDLVFLEEGVELDVSINDLNIGSATSNRRQAIRMIGSGVVGDIVGLYIRQQGLSSFPLNLRIETDNAGSPSGLLVNPNATASIDPSLVPVSKEYRPMKLQSPITITKGQTVWVVLFQGTYGAESFNASNYYAIGYDDATPTTTRFEKTWNGSVWSATNNYRPRCNSREYQGWNLTGATLFGNFNVSAQETTPLSLSLSSDGTNAYIVGTNQIVYQYALLTAWDITTASYTGNSFDLSAQTTGDVRGMFFKKDGTKLYISSNPNNTIYEYDLSTAWDITTASYTGNSFDTTTQISSLTGLFLSNDGLKLYAQDIGGNTYEYNLSIAGDISTASYSGNSGNFTGVANASGLFFNNDLSKVFGVGNTFGQNNRIREYDLLTPGDISSISYTGREIFVLGNEWKNCFFREDGTKLYFASSNSPLIIQYDLPYDTDNLISENIFIGELLSKCDSLYKSKVDYLGFVSSSKLSGQDTPVLLNTLIKTVSGLVRKIVYYPGINGQITDTPILSDVYNTPTVGKSLFSDVLDMAKIETTYYTGALLSINTPGPGTYTSTSVYMTKGGEVNFNVVVSNTASLNNAVSATIQISKDGTNWDNFYGLALGQGANQTINYDITVDIPENTYYRMTCSLGPSGLGGARVTELLRGYF